VKSSPDPPPRNARIRRGKNVWNLAGCLTDGIEVTYSRVDGLVVGHEPVAAEAVHGASEPFNRGEEHIATRPRPEQREATIGERICERIWKVCSEREAWSRAQNATPGGKGSEGISLISLGAVMGDDNSRGAQIRSWVVNAAARARLSATPGSFNVPGHGLRTW
jgi:hypothetical protein